MAAPQTVPLQRFGYTVPTDLTPQTEPGTWRWSGRNTMVSVFAQFDAGKGPTAGSFVARWIINGVTAATVTVAQGTDGITTVLAPRVTIPDGALVQVAITSNGTATAPVIIGFNYY